MKASHEDESRYNKSETERLNKRAETLRMRLSKIYIDKLDGKITDEFWEEKNIQWHAEKDKLVNKLQTLNKSSQNFYECSNLLLNFCKNAQQLFWTDRKVTHDLRILNTWFEIFASISFFNFIIMKDFYKINIKDC